MGILSSEVKFYKPAVITNTGINGGRLSANLLTSNTLNNLLPTINPAERAAGGQWWRKFFAKIDDSENTIASRLLLFLSDINASAYTRCNLVLATNRNTQADISSPRRYGVGRLNASVIAGVSTIVVDCPAGSGAALIYQAGDALWITNGTAGNEYTVSTATWTVDQCSILLTTTLLNDFLLTETKISSCIVSTNLKTTYDNFAVTSTAGTYDDTTYPIVLDNLPTIEQTYTLTFTSATAFTVVGDTLGSLGTGTKAGTLAPTNADFALPYFTLSTSGWGGTFATNDTVVFQTHPAAVPVWLEYNVTTGAVEMTDSVTIKVI